MIAAVIPTRYHPPQLDGLLAILQVEGVRTFLLKSENHGHHIYRMWNAGTTWARAVGADYIAILNDDVDIQLGTIPALAKVLDENPDVGVVYPDINACWCAPEVKGIMKTTGTWGAGGMTGFCFMFRANLDVPFDESWGLWYGDDAFEEAVRASGKAVARAVGVPVRHTPMGTTSRDMEHWGPIIAADRERWDRLHAEVKA